MGKPWTHRYSYTLLITADWLAFGVYGVLQTEVIGLNDVPSLCGCDGKLTHGTNINITNTNTSTNNTNNNMEVIDYPFPSAATTQRALSAGEAQK